MLSKNSPLAAILLTIFLDLLGIGILIPVIPQLLANPASPEFLLPEGMTIDQGYIMLGLLLASYPLAQFFAAPILGQLSDRFGRRPVLIISLIGTAIGYAFFAVGILLQSIPILFAARILDGITGGNLSVAQAAVADVTTPENRSKNFGFIGAAFGLGFVLGPFIGGKLADASLVSWFNAATPFWFAAILSIINVICIIFLLKETNQHRTNQPLRWNQSIHDIVKAFSMEKLRSLFLVGFLYQTGFSFFVAFFSVFLIARYQFKESEIGNLFAYVGIWIAITQAGLTPRVAKFWDERKVLSFSFMGTGFAVLLYLLPGPWTIMLVTVPLFAVVNGLTQANYMGLLSRSAGAEVQGEILGLNTSVAALSQALPPIVSGFIAANTFPEAPIIVAGVIMILAGAVFVMMEWRKAV